MRFYITDALGRPIDLNGSSYRVGGTSALFQFNG